MKGSCSNQENNGFKKNVLWSKKLAPNVLNYNCM